MPNSKYISFPSSAVWLWILDDKKSREKKNWHLICGAGEDCYEYHGRQEVGTNQLLKKLKLQPH